jgi:hypothetical protein
MVAHDTIGYSAPMRRRAGLARILGVMNVVVVAACGGNTTASGAHLQTELPPDKPLRDLSPTDASRFCERVNDFIVHRGSDALCRYFGVSTVRIFVSANIAPATDADARKLCADMEATCHENLTMGKDANLCHLPGPQSTCSASVVEYEACFDEHFAVTERTIPQCSDLELGNIPAVLQDPTLPSASSGPACATLFEHCPPLPSQTSGPGTVDGGM